MTEDYVPKVDLPDAVVDADVMFRNVDGTNNDALYPDRESVTWEELRENLALAILGFSFRDVRSLAAAEQMIDALADGPMPYLRNITSSATPSQQAISDLRHVYANLVNGGVKDSASASRIATGLLGPAIEKLERSSSKPSQVTPTREQIKEVFLGNGFTIKEGNDDLKEYVYDAAYALLELAGKKQ